MLIIEYTDQGPNWVLNGQTIGSTLASEPRVWPRLDPSQLAGIAADFRLQPSHWPTLHRFYFWADGKVAPAIYEWLGLALGKVGDVLYYLGRPVIVPEQLSWELACVGLDEFGNHFVEKWRARHEPVRSQRPHRWQEQANTAWWEELGDTAWASNGTLLYQKGDSAPRWALRDWLPSVSMADIRQSTCPAMIGWKINPEAPAMSKVVSLWERTGQFWGYFKDSKNTWLLGPGIKQRLPMSRRALKQHLEAGYLSPDDPTCVHWVEATIGTRLRHTYRGVYARARLEGNLLACYQENYRIIDLYARAGGNWTTVGLDVLKHPDVRVLLEEGLAPTSNSRSAQVSSKYLGVVAGRFWFLEADFSRADRVCYRISAPNLPKDRRVCTSGSLEEVLGQLERNGLAVLTAQHLLVHF
jgi:hypothetical protein